MTLNEGFMERDSSCKAISSIFRCPGMSTALHCKYSKTGRFYLAKILGSVSFLKE